MSKEILFEEIKCGNLSAFETLFCQFYPSLWWPGNNTGYARLGVGLENGQFVVLNTDQMKNRPESKRLYWQTKESENLGEVVDVIFKTSGKI